MRSVAPALCLVLLVFVAAFFRDPSRTVPAGADVVVSPADGRIVSVVDTPTQGFPGGLATRVTVFLSIFDVHVQRAPLAGTVDHYDYHPGRFLPAWREEASDANEQATLGISSPSGPVLVRQIAGLVARRIVTYPRVGDELSRGARIGLIRFGSRVDLFMPTHWSVLVGPGDRVRGGETLVARIPSDAQEP